MAQVVGDQGAILNVVYKHACRAIPDKCEFRADFVNLCKPFFDTVLSELARQAARTILRDMEETFGSQSEEVWNTMARIEASYEEGDAVFLRGLKSMPTSLRLWELRVLYSSEFNGPVDQIARDRLKATNGLLEQACVRWLEALEAVPKPHKKAKTTASALTEALDLCIKLHPHSIVVWTFKCKGDKKMVSDAVSAVPCVKESLAMYKSRLQQIEDNTERRALLKRVMLDPAANAFDDLVEAHLSSFANPVVEIIEVEKRGIPARIDREGLFVCVCISCLYSRCEFASFLK